MRLHLALLPLMTLLPGIATANPVTAAPGGAVQTWPAQIEYRHQANLLELRRAALRQQVEDGGHLSSTHQAAFQDRLDRENDHYRRSLVNNNPLSVDAYGHAQPVVAPNLADWTNNRLFRGGVAN